MKLLEAIARFGKETPDAPACRFRGEVLTFAQLCAGSDALAVHLARAGEGPVAVCGGHGVLMPLCFLACLKARRTYVPVDCSVPGSRVRRMLELAGVSLVLAVEPLPCDGFCVWENAEIARRAASREAGPALLADAGAIAYILFTSGSTGEPKGVRVTAGSLDAFTEWAAQLAGQGVYLGQAPYSFDLSVMSLYPALVTGGCTASVDCGRGTDYAQWFRELAQAGPEVWVSTPSFARLCLRERSFCNALLPGLRAFVFCGEALPPELAERLFERFPGCRVLNTYGPTETTVAVTSVELSPGDCAEILPVGRARPGVGLQTLGLNGQPLPDGECGEVAILGECVAAGYTPGADNRPFDLFEGRQRYHTGDIGCLRGGMLWLHGRGDRQVKLHGCRVELDDIERNLLRVADVEDAAVLPKLTGDRVDWLVAFVVLQAGAPQGFDAASRVRGELLQLLPPYLVPRRVVVLPALPLTPNGKLDWSKLKELI